MQSEKRVLLKKQPVLALLLAFFLPGLGQIYNEDLNKGLLVLIGCVVFFFVYAPGYLLLWLGAIIDAYVRARTINARGKEVVSDES